LLKNNWRARVQRLERTQRNSSGSGGNKFLRKIKRKGTDEFIKGKRYW
jgi:hypothetical protein